MCWLLFSLQSYNKISSTITASKKKADFLYILTTKTTRKHLLCNIFVTKIKLLYISHNYTTMRKIALSLASVVLIMTACTNNEKKQGEDVPDIKVIEEIPAIVEAYGRIGDGTTMNMLELVGSDGDTTYIYVNSQMIMGGTNPGDEVNVIYNTTGEDNTAQVCINTTALQHLWTQEGADGQSQSLQIDSKGRATTYNMSIEYSGWALKDGHLLLSSPQKIGNERPLPPDTFLIMSLTDESLVLMNGNLTTEFRREN